MTQVTRIRCSHNFSYRKHLPSKQNRAPNYPPHLLPESPSPSCPSSPPSHPTPAPLPTLTLSLSSILPPLATIKPQPALLRLKRNDTPLGEEKHIPLARLDALPARVRDLEVAVDDDFHLVVGVGVDERGARVEAVEARGDGVGGAVAVERVLVGGWGFYGKGGSDRGGEGRGLG